MYITKELLMEKAMNKVKKMAQADLNAMQAREKAHHVIELETLYNDLSPYRTGSDVAGLIADDCMNMKVRIIESEKPKVDNTKQKRAKVIMQGMNNTPYDIPWLRQ